MYRKTSTLAPKIVEGLRGGTGNAHVTALFTDEERPAPYRMFSRVLLEKGATIGYHQHETDCEIYYVISGTGIVSDNGTEIQVGPGDVVRTSNGEGHSVLALSEGGLELLAVIV